jgi:hypothetical protein
MLSVLWSWNPRARKQNASDTTSHGSQISRAEKGFNFCFEFTKLFKLLCISKPQPIFLEISPTLHGMYMLGHRKKSHKN